MKRFFTVRSLLSLALLLIGASALVGGLKNGIVDVANAAFLPVAIFATFAGYLLGFGTWTVRRAWIFILFMGTIVILLEASRIREVLWQTMLQIPGVEFHAVIAMLGRQPFHTQVFQTQLDEILNRAQTFLAGLPSQGGNPNIVLRELFWDFPLLLCCAWSGWWTSRYKNILMALGPSLALHGYILNYTEKSALSLQVAVFASIFLMGIHQQWSIPFIKEDESAARVRNETYATLFILSFVLAITAGWAPIFSVREAAKKLADQQNTNDMLGLEKKVAQSYTASASGLPREHLIDTPPQNLMAVVFTVNTGEQLPVNSREESAAITPRHYWRWLTYDSYNGNAWNTTPIVSRTYSADETLFEYTNENYRVIHQIIKKASPQDGRLYWTGFLLSANKPFESTWRTPPPQKDPLLGMDMLGSLTEAQEYSADSLVVKVNETQLREAPQTYPQGIANKYMILPKTISPRVVDLSHQLTSQAQNAYDKARVIEAYLRTYPYTLDVPPVPPDKEIADYFLFELKKGYCDYYATSMAVLARAAGLPARLVIGYSSGDYDAKTGQYTVREGNAHSWVEIYFPTVGWVEFEPTANQPLIELPLTSSDSAATTAPATHVSRSEVTYDKHGHFTEKNLLPPILLFILVFILVCAWYVRSQGLFFSYDTIGSMYEYIYYHGKKIYADAPTNETPSLFAEKLKMKLRLNRRFLHPAAGELDQLTSLYLKETYSPHPITKNEQEQAVKVWRKLFWRLLYARMVVVRHSHTLSENPSRMD